ncbi:unnamed protein product [Citrullus colocynthis]|uniref:Uncharacterized protein n=1 Tax=Citrullus colocynthis TaxID=252529 RepID=A0ABP0Z906_9ROSI
MQGRHYIKHLACNSSGAHTLQHGPPMQDSTLPIKLHFHDDDDIRLYRINLNLPVISSHSGCSSIANYNAVRFSSPIDEELDSLTRCREKSTRYGTLQEDKGHKFVCVASMADMIRHAKDNKEGQVLEYLYCSTNNTIVPQLSRFRSS